MNTHTLSVYHHVNILHFTTTLGLCRQEDHFRPDKAPEPWTVITINGINPPFFIIYHSYDLVWATENGLIQAKRGRTLLLSPSFSLETSGITILLRHQWSTRHRAKCSLPCFCLLVLKQCLHRRKQSSGKVSDLFIVSWWANLESELKSTNSHAQPLST